MIKGLLLVCALMIGLLIVGKVVTDEIAYQLESQDELEQETIDAINNMKESYNTSIPIEIVLICIAIVALLTIAAIKYGNNDIDYSDSTGDDIFPIERERKMEDAITILKRRYANGEINSYEYTERMSRL